MLELAILGLLKEQELHGYELKKRLVDVLGPFSSVSFGSLYPALHRLEHRGWIDAEWRVSELGRRAKYYRLTASGRRQLAVEASEWERMAHAIGRVMKLA